VSVILDPHLQDQNSQHRSGFAAALSGKLMGLTFSLAVFLSAALLFVLEPMFGKMVLPRLGGSPSVWTTCMLFFQAALLLGYLYAHLGPRWLGVRPHAFAHILLLAVCVLALPIRIMDISPTLAVRHQIVWLLVVLALSLGAPFILLSSTGPLVQLWFAHSSHPERRNPYFLYAASNAGSLLGLLLYPFLIEPALPLSRQTWLWSAGYLGVIALVGCAAVNMTRNFSGQEYVPTLSSPAPTTRMRLRWLALAFVPSSFVLALTTHVTTDIAAVPLVWVVPLVLYLLSFTIVFARRAYVSQALLSRWQPVGLIALAILNFWGPSGSSPWILPLHLMVFFLTALVCHGALAATKPPADQLTDFYLCIAVGGVLGGIFNALIAPALFNSVLEYSLTLLAACAVRLWLPEGPVPDKGYGHLAFLIVPGALLALARWGIGDRPALIGALAASVVAALVCLRVSRAPVRFTIAIAGVVLAGVAVEATQSDVLLAQRNFFGVRQVRNDTRTHRHVLLHGTTEHGSQSTEPDRRREPLSYYSRQGPVGDIFRLLPPGVLRNVGVIGLGTGAMAAYAGAGEQWVFYEIDPDIVRMARDTSYFTYLRDASGSVETALGDGRLSLAAAPAHKYDLLVIDAFNSDAIPIHLLTAEALSIYRSKLSRNGVVLFHLSNRYLDLEPVLGRLAQAAHLSALIREDTRPTWRLLESGANPSVWAAVGLDSAAVSTLQRDSGWRPLRVRQSVHLWTDDYSNIFSVFR
jgi:hypothetical protein